MHFPASSHKIPIFRPSPPQSSPATCSIAVTNPFYLSALTRKQMAKRQQLAKKEHKKRKKPKVESHLHRGMYVWVVSGENGSVCVGAWHSGRRLWYIAEAQLEHRPQNETKRWLPCKQATIALATRKKMETIKPGKIAH